MLNKLWQGGRGGAGAPASGTPHQYLSGSALMPTESSQSLLAPIEEETKAGGSEDSPDS